MLNVLILRTKYLVPHIGHVRKRHINGLRHLLKGMVVPNKKQDTNVLYMYIHTSILYQYS